MPDTKRLTDEGSVSKRDRRSHDQRVADLAAVFARLKVKAIASGLKNDASAAKVLEAAKVNRTYFYVKNKLKDKPTLAKYHAVRDAIQDFQNNFDAYGGDTIVDQLKTKLKQVEAQRSQLANNLIENEKRIAGLQNDNTALKKKVLGQNEYMIDVMHSATVNTRSDTNVFSEARIVSPDQYLWRNGHYLFDDTNVKRQAWERSREDLKKALKRPLPTRVYLLIGPPCAGKSTWSKKPSNLYPDMHSVVIDATNLTQFSRLEWISLINKYRSNKEIKVCAVVFLTPTSVLQSRNNRREPAKRFEDAMIREKERSLEFPDPLREEIDEMVVVRGNDD